MKNKIIVTKTFKVTESNNRIIKKEFLEFYLKNSNGMFWLFNQPFSKGVYFWFKDGRSENEVLNFRNWKYNERLNNTITHIKREINYVKKYVMGGCVA
ncbi:MAG: hypothetical protein IJN75_06250 [Clostridia bacterium]|nr:hypothetical protein [Clostridia bacterium]